MSWMKWAFSQRITARQKSVLLFVAFHGSDSGLWIGTEQALRHGAGLAERLLMPQLRKLEEEGLIEFFSDGGVFSIQLKGKTK